MNGRRHFWVAAGCIETGCVDGVLDVDLEVVLEVLADARQVLGDEDAVIAKVAGRADARQHQQLGRVDRAAAEDHLVGEDVLCVVLAAVPPQDLHADRPAVLDEHPAHERAGPTFRLWRPRTGLR